MATELDEHVEQFRYRPLDTAGPFTFVAADALTMKICEGGWVINAVVMVATGVNGDGHREVLGMRVATSETEQHATSSSPTSQPAAWPGSAWINPTGPRATPGSTDCSTKSTASCLKSMPTRRGPRRHPRLR